MGNKIFPIGERFIIAFMIMSSKFVSTTYNLSRLHSTDFYLGEIYDVCDDAIDLSCSVSRWRLEYFLFRSVDRPKDHVGFLEIGYAAKRCPIS